MQISCIRDVNFIKILAETLNVNLGEEACRLIGSEAEYILRLVIQNALKYMHQFNREQLKIEDVTYALKDLNIYDKIYGYEEHDSVFYKKVAGVWAMKTKTVDIDQALKKELLNLKSEPQRRIQRHWLSIGGVIPKIPENASIKSKKDLENITQTAEVETKDISLKNLVLKDNLEAIMSKGLHSFLSSIIERIKIEERIIDETIIYNVYQPSKEFKKVIHCLEKNPGLNNMLPFLLNFIHNSHGKDEPIINGFLKKINQVEIIRAVLFNINFNLEYNLHLIVKILLTFITSNKISINYTNSDIMNEIKLRNMSAKTLVYLIKKYEDKYTTLKYNILDLVFNLMKNDYSNYQTLYGIFRIFYYMESSIIIEIILPYLGEFTQKSNFLKDIALSSSITTEYINNVSSKKSIVTSNNSSTNNKQNINIENVNKIIGYHVYLALMDICIKMLSNLLYFSKYSIKQAKLVYDYAYNIFGETILFAMSKVFKNQFMSNMVNEVDQLSTKLYLGITLQSNLLYVFSRMLIFMD